MEQIAFLGLGRMGAPMARRLIARGHLLVVWNRTAARAESLAGAADSAAEVVVAHTPAEAVRDADIVITMVADPAAVESVVEDMADAIRPGACLIEMSTIGPAALRAVRKRLPHGVDLVDAPAMGSVDASAAGTLRILAGGDADRVEPILAALGTVVRCGELGAGAALKIVLISAVVSGVALVGEALKLADALGVDGARDALAASPLGGVVGRAFAEGVDFPIALAAKDLGLALDAADLPMIAAARQALLGAADQYADLGWVVPR